MLKKIELKYLNLIKILIVIFFLFLFAIFIFNNFQVPDYYTNRQLALQSLNNSNLNQIDFDNLYRNKYYYFQNGLFHVCTIVFELISIILLIGSKILKKIINNKSYIKIVLIYLFINLVYPIWANLILKIYEIELQKYIYVSIEDSIMIPIVGMYVMLYCLAFLYYPLVNLVTFIVFNAKFTNKFLIIIYYIFSIIIAMNMIYEFSVHYCAEFIYVHLFELLYFVVIFESIKMFKIKKQNI